MSESVEKFTHFQVLRVTEVAMKLEYETMRCVLGVEFTHQFSHLNKCRLELGKSRRPTTLRQPLRRIKPPKKAKEATRRDISLQISHSLRNKKNLAFIHSGILKNTLKLCKSTENSPTTHTGFCWFWTDYDDRGVTTCP